MLPKNGGLPAQLRDYRSEGRQEEIDLGFIVGTAHGYAEASPREVGWDSHCQEHV